MKASLATSTQICMDQQKLIQMLQASSLASSTTRRPMSALDAGDPLAGHVGARAGLLPRPPSAPPIPAMEFGGARGARDSEEVAAVGAAAIAQPRDRARGSGPVSSTAGARRGFHSGNTEGAGDVRDVGIDDESSDDDMCHRSYSQSPIPAAEPNAVSTRNTAYGLSAEARQPMLREGADSGSDGDGDNDGSGDGDWDGDEDEDGDRGRSSLLDDDLISHSSLRRAFDETFLNQPLRGGHRHRDLEQRHEHQKLNHRAHVSEGGGGGSGGTGGGVESRVRGLEIEVDANLLASQLRHR